MHAVLFTIALALAHQVQAHGDHAHIQQPLTVPAGADWMTRHMIEEHLIQYFDAGSFFTLHDFSNSGEWSHEDIYKTYGLHHESTKDIPEADKHAAVDRIITDFDRDGSRTISFAEYTIGVGRGLALPDLGWGPGHHGDDEYEYEIHHFQKYHGDDATLEDLTHPEDIEHFKMHDLLDEQAEKQERLDAMPVVRENIPAKFLRHQ